MNKTTRIIVGVVIVVILLLGAYFILGKKSSNPMQSVQRQVTQMTTQKHSLADFFSSMAGSQKCTFSDKTGNSSGTVYVGDGKMRGDFESSNNGKTTSSHMINDGTYVYYWADGQPAGYKMSMELAKKQMAQVTMSPNGNTPSETQPSSGPVNVNQQADYSCGAWSVDASQFALPQGVTFTDYSSMMQKVENGAAMQKAPAAPQGMTQQQNQAACQQCNQVPAGSMRNQCLSALKCQ